uniref:Uncharacterized protein n=1 Tax=Biomphalaria glabrata TaxID=6526 RepID=A0A2C9L4L9_BIOGL
MDSQNVQGYHIANEDQETGLPEEGNSKDLSENEAKVQENVKDDSDPGESDTIVAVEIVHAILDEQEITFPSKDVNHNPMIEIKEADSKDTAVNGMEGNVTLVTTETFLAPVEDNEEEHMKESSEVSVMLSHEEPEKSSSGQHETPDTNLGMAPGSTDTELDAFFGTGDSKETEGRGHFPALDFVDLETDEEGHQDLNRDDGGGGEEESSVHRETTCETPQGLKDAADSGVAEEEEQKLNSEIKLERISQIPLDDSEDKSENFAPLMEPQLLGNKNNNNQEMRLEEVDVSNNADDKLSDEEDFRHLRSSDLRYTFSSSSRAQPASPAYSHYENRSYQHSYDPSESRPAVSKNSYSTDMGGNYEDNRSYRIREENNYYRSADSSSVDSTSLSTRYTPIERGDPKRDSARSESMTVPKFKTLQDQQQVSWLEMFKMIEEQHKCDLQAQYMEHQRILQEMQRNMEKELIKQQETLKKRLSSHREILEELSPSRGSGRKMDEDHNINQSRKFDEDDFKESRRMNESSSHTTLMGVPVSLRNPPPLNRYIQHEFLEKKKEMSSPSRQADTSLNLSRLSTVGGDKQLRGGVYSSPLPLAKVKHKNSPRGSKSYEDTHYVSPRDDMSRNSVHWAYDVATSQRPGSGDSSLCESDDVLSPRTRISLREKHAKHLADLKAYYEEELQELRQLLAARVDRLGADGGRSGMTAGDKILSSENQELRQKCKELQDMLHDSRIENRELQQKIQGLEIRASDYAGRFDTAQAQVLSLKTRLEEVTEFAKEKEALAAEVELKHKKTIEALQMSFKKEKELSESLHNAKITIQRLVDKYETLEKDYALIKDSLAATEEKLFTSRSEAMDSSSKLTRLEHEVKQLKHDNEVLKHERAIACRYGLYESALNRLPAQGHRGEKDKLEAELDRVDKELGSVRMSLKRYHVLKSTI